MIGLLVAPGCASRPVAEATPPGSTDLADYAAKFNAYRQVKGRFPLEFTDDLNRIAQLRLEEIKVRFSHTSDLNEHLGENIVEGVWDNDEALARWQHSPSHNAGMLDPEYLYTGYAIGGGYAVQLFSMDPTINGVPQLPPGWHYP